MKEVSIEEIKKAEKLLLPKGKTFQDANNERINVINEIHNNLDVVACPGSGKTTVLLAKLLILADRMPLEENRGICVLTHTNVAIDEIKERVGNVSDKLFKYPNFFGTIQSFVNNFLAKQALVNYYQTAPRIIDSEYGNKKLLSGFYGLNSYESTLHKMLWASLFNSYSFSKKNILDFFELEKDDYDEFIEKYTKNKVLVKKATKYILNSKKTTKRELKDLISDSKILNKFIELREDNELKIKNEKPEKVKKITLDYINEKLIGDRSIGFKSGSGSEFVALKEKLFKDGVLTFRDAFDLAIRYLSEYSKLKKTFSQRFKYVFVDEMQDTDAQQLNIIKDLFKGTNTITQYYGDPNQAIFNNVKEGMIWKPGENGRKILNISDSKRFGDSIAVVLNKIKIKATIKLVGDTDVKSLKPHLFLFKKGKKEKVLEEYANLISKNLEELGERTVYKAVGWVGKPRTLEQKKAGKLNIQSFHSSFQKKAKKQKKNYNNLKYYLQRSELEVKQKGAKILYKSIVLAFLHVLELAGVKNKVETTKNGVVEKRELNYTKNSFLKHLKKQKKYDQFRVNVALWCNSIYCHSQQYENDTIEEIRKYLKSDFSTIFDYTLGMEVLEFIDEPKGGAPPPSKIQDEKTEYFEYNGIKIEVGTVHSVKGETHTATLYMETFYAGFESKRIVDCLTGTNLAASGSIKKKTFKMVHVGFSRPTHLLCFAMCEERLKAKDKKLLEENGEWEIRIIN